MQNICRNRFRPNRLSASAVFQCNHSVNPKAGPILIRMEFGAALTGVLVTDILNASVGAGTLGYPNESFPGALGRIEETNTY